ncbi:MAG: GNAT family N-acetyltransferase [Ignavibacteriaceae bacterium]|nr:GNAT family N-acetyltransferase [Ignavibacteriaceae bacterium]
MNETKILFRPWDKNDFPHVYDILKKSWDSAYSSFVPKDDLDFYLNQNYNLSKLEELYNKHSVFCFVAEVDGKAVGWLKLSISDEEKKNYLSSIYVLPDFQKLKIGQRLMTIAFTKAKENGFPDIWIGVMEKNIPALEWYKKIGFVFVENLPFKMGKTTISHLIGVKEILD